MADLKADLQRRIDQLAERQEIATHHRDQSLKEAKAFQESADSSAALIEQYRQLLESLG